MVERPGDEPLVAVRRPVEPVVEAVEGPRHGVPVPDPLDVGVDPAGGEHRVEGEGDEEGDEDREGDRDPELEEEAPHDPLHEGDRDEDGDDGERRREDGEADLGRADPGRRHVVLPLLEVPHDVLPDDDRVVDEEPDRERQRHERHDVQRHPEEVHDDERGDDRDRERQPRDDGRAPGVQEEEDDEDRQDRADDQGGRHVVDGLLDHDGAVPHELDLDGRRKLAPEPFDLLRHRLDDADRVRLALLEDVDRDGRDAVDEGELAPLLDRVLDLGDLAERHGDAAAARDDHRPEAGDLLRLARDADRHLLPAPVEPAEGRVHVLAGEPGDDLVDAEAEGVEPRRVEVDGDLALALADEVHLSDAGEVLDAPLDLPVDERRQLARGHLVGAHRERDDRHPADVELLDDGLLDPRGEVVADGGDLRRARPARRR